MRPHLSGTNGTAHRRPLPFSWVSGASSLPQPPGASRHPQHRPSPRRGRAMGSLRPAGGIPTPFPTPGPGGFYPSRTLSASPNLPTPGFPRVCGVGSKGWLCHPSAPLSAAPARISPGTRLPRRIAGVGAPCYPVRPRHHPGWVCFQATHTPLRGARNVAQWNLHLSGVKTWNCMHLTT